MLELARKRKLDMVLVWRYDLFARPTLSSSKREFIYWLLEEGLSTNQISKHTGIAYRTVYNYVQSRNATNKLIP